MASTPTQVQDYRAQHQIRIKCFRPARITLAQEQWSATGDATARPASVLSDVWKHATQENVHPRLLARLHQHFQGQTRRLTCQFTSCRMRGAIEHRKPTNPLLLQCIIRRMRCSSCEGRVDANVHVHAMPLELLPATTPGGPTILGSRRP